MTNLPGFDRPADLYECANAHGVHVGSMDKLVRFAQEILRRANNSTALSEITQASEEIGGYELPTCWCATCDPNIGFRTRMVLCPNCGNKRCPHATNHELACSGSNEPGQKGSSYEHCAPIEERE
jgi:Zn finger protein HypA/HybF involved in hydrogenase expression